MESLSIVAVSLALYMLPTIVGAARQRHNLLAIGVLNLLLGWTLIGWVVALVWALTANPPGVADARERAEPVERTREESEARISRARVWIAVIAVIAALGVWGYYQNPPPPDEPTQQE